MMDAIAAEIERRRAAKLAVQGPDATTWLLAELGEMAGRLRAAPDFEEPTAEEKAKTECEFEKWSYEHVCASR